MTQDTTTVLVAENVYKTFYQGTVATPVLHGIDIVVRRGEFVAIEGPSGCGKTTLLHVLGLMSKPTQAQRLSISGHDCLQAGNASRAQVRTHMIGFVFQRFNLLPVLSARRNIQLAAYLAGQDGQCDTRMQELFDQFDLAGHADKKPSQLSIGQQQRFAIVRALVNKPALLLADEPTGNLDSVNTESVLRLIRQAHDQYDQTTVMITHNREVAAAADRVLHMKDGRFV